MTTEKPVAAEVWIPLTQGKVAVIDFDDFEKVRGFKWGARKDNKSSNFYAFRSASRALGKQRTILLHREIMQPELGREVDHRDGDGLNNRRSNLRLVTHKQNMTNQKPRKNKTSNFRGVCKRYGNQKWLATIRSAGVSRHLGYFDCELTAARAYDVAARKCFGEFAQPNFPLEGLK